MTTPPTHKSGRFHISERSLLLLLSLLVGLCSGLAAVLLTAAIDGIKHLLDNTLSLSYNIQYLILPGAGMLISLLLLRYLIKDNIGHGVTKVLLAVSRGESKIKPHNMWSSMLTSSITIGFGGYEAGFIKKYVPPFLEKYPSYSVVLLEYPYQQIVQELIAKSCDIVICPEIRVRDHSNIKYIKVSNARYTITVSKDNPLAKLDKIPPELLNGMTFICPSDKNSNWQMIEAFHKICDDFGIVPGKLIYSNTTLAIMQMVEMDLGITMLSSAFSSYSSFDVRNIPIDTKVKARKVHTVACLEPITRPIVSKFMDYVQEAASLSMSSRNGEVLK